jgi:LmbE family N-acetylglucosaminyl deacetylase
MDWIYISSHLDDVALSCGGLVWEQAQAGDATAIWTVCAGDPPDGPLSPFAEELHARWGVGREAARQRRLEDQASCIHLGAEARHFSIPDCIYRRAPSGGAPLYASNQAIMGPVRPDEAGLLQTLGAELAEALPAGAILVCPLAIGGHVDHRLTRLAVESTGRRLWYYVDYPYILEAQEALEQLRQEGWSAKAFAVSENGLRLWGQAVAAHASQISTFWPDLFAMQAALEGYYQDMGGVILWQPNNACDSG